MRMLRASMCLMKRSENACSSCSTRVIDSFFTAMILLAVVAWAVPMRIVWPARQPSPKKSPGDSIATTASWPVSDSTESFTPPF